MFKNFIFIFRILQNYYNFKMRIQRTCKHHFNSLQDLINENENLYRFFIDFKILLVYFKLHLS
jgi:hypothetical protein